MSPKTKTVLKITVVLFAMLGLAATIIVGAGIYLHRQQAPRVPENDDGIAMLQAIYGGTPTKLGVVIRQAEKDMGRVVVKHFLIQPLGRQPGQPIADQAEHELLVYGIREIKLDVAAQIETGELDIAALGDSATADMLVDREHGSWIGSAAWMVRKDGAWRAEVCCKELFWQGEAQGTPDVEWPKLSPKAPSFRVGNRYFALTEGAFEQVLYMESSIDDLDECLRYRDGQAQRDKEREEAAEQRRAAKAAAAAAASDAGSEPSQSEEDEEDEEEMVDTEPDFVCARATAKLNILPQAQAGFYTLEVLAEGEGPSGKPQAARYQLSFDLKEKRYFFERVNGHLLGDALNDSFIMKLMEGP